MTDKGRRIGIEFGRESSLVAKVLALDISGNCMHAVEVTAGGRSAAAAFSALLPAELAPANIDVLATWLRDLLARHSVRTNHAVCALGRSRVSLRLVRVPKCPDQELPAIVQFAVDSEPVGAPGPTVSDFQVGPNVGQERQALVAQIGRQTIDTLAEVLRRAGLTVEHIGLRPFATRYLWERLSPESHDGPVLLTNATDRETVELSVWDDDRLLVCRSVRVDQNGSSVGRLVSEVKRTLAAHQSQDGSAAIEYIAVVGEQSESLAAALRGAIEAKVEAFGIDGGWSLPGETGGGEFATALAAGWRQLDRAGWPIDLLNPKKPPVKRDHRKRLVALAVALVVLVPVIAYGFVSWRIRAYDQRIDSLQTEIDRLKGVLRANDPLQRRHQSMKDWEAGSVNWAYELGELVANFPDTTDAYVERLEMTAGRKNRSPSFKLSGRTRSQDVVTKSQANLAGELGAHYRVTHPAKLQPSDSSDEFRWRFVDLQLALTADPPDTQAQRTQRWRDRLVELKSARGGKVREPMAIRTKAVAKAAPSPSALATTAPPPTDTADDGDDAVARLLGKIKAMPAEEREKYIESSVPGPLRARVRKLLAESAAESPASPAVAPPPAVPAPNDAASKVVAAPEAAGAPASAPAPQPGNP
jgi:Tfp pilus assembly PilM family ATPase